MSLSTLALTLLLIQSAEEKYQLGVRLYVEGRLLEAEEALQEALAADPAFGPAQFQLGAVYLALGRLAEAGGLFENVLARYPKSADLELRVGLAYFSAGRDGEARPHLEQVLQIDPKNVEARLALGQIRAREKDYPRALRLFEEACRDAPENAQAHFYRAVVLEVMEKEDAVAAAREAVRLKPEEPRFHRFLGGLLLELEQWPLAESELAEAVRLGGEEAGLLLDLGRTYLNQNRLDRAEQTFHRSAELKPGEAPVHYYLGLALLQLDKNEQAVAALERARDLGSRPNASVLYQLSTAYARLERLDEAEQALVGAVALAPERDDARLLLGWVHYLKVEDEKAEAEFAKALQMAPSGRAHFYLGLAQASLGKLEQAVTSYRRAVELDPELAEAHLALGKCLVQLGRDADAEPSLRTALTLKPGAAEAHVQLGIVARRRGALQESARLFEAALAADSQHLAAWYNLALVYEQLGWKERARETSDRYQALATEAAGRGKSPSIASRRAAAPPGKE